MFKEHEFWIVCWIAKFRMLFVFILEIASTSKPFSFLCHFLPHPKLHVLLNCLIIPCATVLVLGKHDLGECLLRKTLLGTCHRSRAGEMWVGGGGCVRVSSRAAQLRLCKKTPANRRVNSQNRTQSFPEEQRKNAVSWTIIIMTESCPGALAESLAQFCYSWKSSLCYLPSSHSPFCGGSVSPSLFPNQPPLFTASPFCCQWLWRGTVARQKSHPSAGIQFETYHAGTVHLHVEQEQAMESIHFLL